MPISLTVSAENATDFFKQLQGAVGALRVAAVGMPEAAKPVEPAPAAEQTKTEPTVEHIADDKVEVISPDTKVDTKKRGKKAAEPVQIDIEQSIAEAKQDAPPTDRFLGEEGKEPVRQALKKLAAEKGDDEVWKLLSEYKAKSASTVPEDKRAELIARIDALCEVA